MVSELRRELIRNALDVWAPHYPRRVNRTQEWADTPSEAVDYLLEAEGKNYNAPFVSTYAFPRGHTKHGNIPQIDTLFIDFDFEDGDYEAGSGDEDAWRRDLSQLLVRVRRVAEYIENEGTTGWRASLSGHKGVHLFLDFPQIAHDAGTFQQFINGMSEYADDLVAHIEAETGLDSLHNYVDVTSSDLGRLCRVPNTVHGGATESFGETRFCVPVSIEELTSISVDNYAEYTRAPRPVDFHREPNQEVHDVLSQYIRTASDGSSRTRRGGPSVVDWSLVEDYREKSNDSIELEDLEFITADRPCVWKFYQRDDKYQHGQQSHYMELFCIRELTEHNVPIDVMVDFLDSAPEFDEEYSRRRIKEIIAHDYNRFTIRRLLQNAPEFCGYDDCSLCQAVIAEEDGLTTDV
jgi:hypothetical protein